MVTGKFGDRIYWGTGILISPSVVLTCAHNLYNRGSEEQAREVKFSLSINKNQGKTYKIKNFCYPK